MVKMKTAVAGVGVAMFGEAAVIDKRRRGSRALKADSVLSDFSSSDDFSASIASIMTSDLYDSPSSSEEQDDGIESEDIDDISENTELSTQRKSVDASFHSGELRPPTTKPPALGDYDSVKAKIAARFSSSSSKVPNEASDVIAFDRNSGTNSKKVAGKSPDQMSYKTNDKTSHKRDRVERRRSSRRSLPQFDLDTLLADTTFDVPEADDFEDSTSLGSKLSGVSLKDYVQSLAQMPKRSDGSNSSLGSVLGSSWVSGDVHRRKSSTLVDYSMYYDLAEYFPDSDED